MKIGRIIKMEVASRSHVVNPYYAEIIYYNPHAKDGEVKMKTRIPYQHSLDWTVGSNWEYHLPRVSKVYQEGKMTNKLFNQKLQHIK